MRHRREQRYSTRDMLRVEQAVVESALRRRRAGVALADEAAVVAALGRRPAISPEQTAMVRRLTRGGEGVTAVVPGPGAGKTSFGLDAAREAWETSGIPVGGACLAADAASGLQEGRHQEHDHRGAADRPRRHKAWGGWRRGAFS